MAARGFLAGVTRLEPREDRGRRASRRFLRSACAVAWVALVAPFAGAGCNAISGVGDYRVGVPDAPGPEDAPVVSESGQDSSVAVDAADDALADSSAPDTADATEDATDDSAGDATATDAPDAADADAADALDAAEAAIDDASDAAARDASDGSTTDARDAGDAGDGSGPSYTISGSVSGFAFNLTLSDGFAATMPLGVAGSFSFPALPAGTMYTVTVTSPPAGMVCTVMNGTGTLTADVTNVIVTCADGYTIRATIGGNTTTGLVLSDGSGIVSVAAGAGTATFPALATGTAYMISVTSQPSSELCAVTAGASGTIGNANVTNVQVSCVMAPACSPTCAAGTACSTGGECASGTCTSGLCTAMCAPACVDGVACSQNSDCASMVCTGDVCAAPSCSPSCGLGKACGATSDCATRVCTDGLCAACSPMCVTGAACTSDVNCASGVCRVGNEKCE